MVASWQLLAEAEQKVGLRAWRDQLLWAGPAMAVALLLLALVVAWLQRWRKQVDAVQPTPDDELTHFRVLYERGEISREEFDRIEARLQQRLRQMLDMPQPPAPVPNPPPDPSAPPPPDRPAI
jgi:hypothetical protein